MVVLSYVNYEVTASSLEIICRALEVRNIFENTISKLFLPGSACWCITEVSGLT